MRIINNNKEKKMTLLRKTTLGMIGVSSIFAANPGAAFAPIGAGMIVIGAAIGIGMFASAAANSIARQPEAAKDISGAVNLPLFLLEGVAIIALVVCILAVVG
jgi:F-type H+-transporting ATPase subunit c|tara:strand:- start:202 stop:510 length:309 start_codon:yes stop_codon:yes gene_type:complete